MSKHPGPILIVDDDPDILTAGKLLLKRHYQQVDTTSNPTELPHLLEGRSYAAILLDMNFGPGKSSGEEGFYWLRQILETDADAVVMMITAHGGVDLAVEVVTLEEADQRERVSVRRWSTAAGDRRQRRGPRPDRVPGRGLPEPGVRRAARLRPGQHRAQPRRGDDEPPACPRSTRTPNSTDSESFHSPLDSSRFF